jgi:hypothetical protein
MENPNIVNMSFIACRLLPDFRAYRYSDPDLDHADHRHQMLPAQGQRSQP